MQSLAVTTVASLAIAVTIVVMAKLKSPNARAFVYALPIPISIALISTSTPVNSLNILGLALTMCFLWSVYYLHQRRGINILASDIGASIAYVAIAYITARYVRLPFAASIAGFLALWLIVVLRTKNIQPQVGAERPNTTPLWAKGIIIFVLAYLLFTLKVYLAAFVVTFPYNGVFVVYENRSTLHSLAMLVTRNSLGLCSLFVAYYLANETCHFNKAVALACGWAACLSLLFIINKTIKFRA